MSWLTSKISRENLDYLISPYSSDGNVLEVGAHGSPSYGRFFKNKVGIDIKSGPGVNVVGSVYELPFQDGTFDMVLCMSILEHLEEPSKAIREMRRVLKPGGRILVSVPFMFPIHDTPSDYWRFTKFGLKYLFRDGWEIEKLCAETTTQETFAVLFQRLAYQTKMRFNKISKLKILVLAKIFQKMPNFVTKVFGDIRKKIEEPEAFASAFFLVATKK